MTRTLSIGALVVLCAAALYFASGPFSNSARADVLKMSPEEARTHWRGRIEQEGVERAYKEFKSVYMKAEFNAQHPAAHMFGALLFEHEGLEGFRVCDQDFAFGCYHGYFGKAVADKGTEVIEELDRACVRQYGELGTGCQHGIGHGVMEYMGDDIAAALELCKLTTQLEPLFGCTSGVFMEYNTPISFSEDDTDQKPRDFDPKHPAEPCVSVEKRFRTSCYFEIGLWWKHSLGGDFAGAGELCAAVSDRGEQEACYLGLGGVAAPSADFDISRTLALCEEMPTGEGDLWCAAGASWVFWAIPEKRAISHELCESLPNSADARQCAERAKLIDA